MKILIILIGIFNCFFNVDDAYCQSTIDTLPSELWKEPNEIAATKSIWLNNAIVSYDSMLMFIVHKANFELNNTKDIRYISNIVQGLLSIHKDLAYNCILDNLTINKYVNPTSGIDVTYHIYSYPVYESFKRVPLNEALLFKKYIVYSDYLDKDLSEEEIRILNFILVSHDPAFAYKWIDVNNYEGNAQKNMKAILGVSQN